MGKLFGQTPSDLLGLEIEDTHINLAINLACATAFWEDENYHYKKSQETAQSEAGEISRIIENYQKTLNERG